MWRLCLRSSLSLACTCAERLQQTAPPATAVQPALPGCAQQSEPFPVQQTAPAQAPPKLFAEVDRAHSAGPFAEQVPARPAAQVQLDELSAEVVGAHSAEAKVQPELLGLAQVQPGAQVQPVLSELEGQVQAELLAQVDGAHSAGLFAEQVPARLAAKLELSAEVVRAQSAEAQAAKGTGTARAGRAVC